MHKNSQTLKLEAQKYIKYEKDVENKIAYLTFSRPEKLNALNIGMKMNFAELVFKANVDDDVKVLVIRGDGKHFGTGADLPEHGDMLSDSDEDSSLLHELEINDPDVTYPPKGSFRYLFGLTDNLSKARSGARALQEFKKISIVEVKGYCYGYHFYLAADADLVVSSDDALFGHPSFRYVGWGPRLWTWCETLGYRRFAEMLFTGRPFTATEMHKIGFTNSIVPIDQIEDETQKYAIACSRSRPTDTVVIQKTFLELYKQYRGEYTGSILTSLLEGMHPIVRNDSASDASLGADTFNKGLNNVVKDLEASYPPEWRMSYSGRSKAK